MPDVSTKMRTLTLCLYNLLLRIVMLCGLIFKYLGNY